MGNKHLFRLTAASCIPLATKEIINMAIDGTDILESDLSIDVQNEILDRYDSGQPADEIRSYLKNELDNLSSSLDLEIYISTTCLTLWKIGLLDDYFVNRLKTIVDNGADMAWAEIDKIAISKRNIALQKLLKKVSVPILKVRKPKKYKTLINRLFTKGEVIAFQIDNKYRCFIFEDFYQYRKDAYYAFVPTTYNDYLKPSIDTILIEEVPVTKTNAMGSFGVRKLSLYYTDVEKLKDNFISIGHLSLDLEIEQLGFNRQITSVNGLSELEHQINDILEGNKIELYACYELK